MDCASPSVLKKKKVEEVSGMEFSQTETKATQQVEDDSEQAGKPITKSFSISANSLTLLELQQNIRYPGNPSPSKSSFTHFRHPPATKDASTNVDHLISSNDKDVFGIVSDYNPEEEFKKQVDYQNPMILKYRYIELKFGKPAKRDQNFIDSQFNPSQISPCNHCLSESNLNQTINQEYHEEPLNNPELKFPNPNNAVSSPSSKGLPNFNTFCRESNSQILNNPAIPSQLGKRKRHEPKQQLMKFNYSSSIMNAYLERKYK